MPSNRHYLILFGVYGVTLNEKVGRSRYTGKSLFEQLDGKVPVGLLCGAVGGSPIEFWLPKGHVNNSVCGADVPPCDPGGPNNYTDSEFFERLIAFFQPYTLGSVVWDQAERDVHCLPQPSPVCLLCDPNRLFVCARVSLRAKRPVDSTKTSSGRQSELSNQTVAWCAYVCAQAAPENETDRYACLERQLVESWRAGFNSNFAFTAIQLPGYLGDCGN